MKKRKILKKIFNNWALKLFSLVAAFLLWLLVMTIEDPESQKVFYNIPVKLVNTEVLENEDMVYEILDNTDLVKNVTITAKKTIRDELSSSDIVAEADFSNLTVTNTVEITFYSLRYNDEISDISGSNEILKLNIEAKKTKRLALTVQITGEVAEGHMINNVTLDQNRIEVSGPASVIAQIASAQATVDVTESTGDISTYADIDLYDVDGNPVSAERLEKNVNSVRVKVEILDTKTVPIQYTTMGVPAIGYLFTGEIESTVGEVTIAGTTAALKQVNAIVVPQEELNITGQASNLVVNVDIEDYLPNGIILADKTFNGMDTVTAYIEKEEVRDLTIPAENIGIVNIPAGYTVEFDEELTEYTLRIKGLKADVNLVDASTLYGQIDMKTFMEGRNWEELNPGVYDVEVEFVLSEEVNMVQSIKAYILITKIEETE